MEVRHAFNQAMGNQLGSVMPPDPFHDFHLRLPSGFWHAIQDHAASNGVSAGQIVRKAIAEFLDLDHHTLWQLSTSSAVVEGVFKGSLKVADLNEHGDFGIGTFDHLDGEGVMLNGEIWQARADGQLVRAPDDAMTPFWIATHFKEDQAFNLPHVSSFEDLGHQLDPLRPSANVFMAIKIEGCFRRICVRSVGRVEEGTSLLTAASQQKEFVHEQLHGTLVGFWSPEYARSFNIPGYHFHFLSNDRCHGGHLLDLEAENLVAGLHLESDLKLALPQTRDFLEADLSGDPSAALASAETGRNVKG